MTHESSWHFDDSMSSWHRDDSFIDADLIEMGGAGVETQEKKKIVVPLSKNDKKKISWASEVGVCFRITGTRFPYYISLSTIWWARRNGNLLVQIDPKNGFQTDKVKDGVWIDRGYLPTPPTSYLTSHHHLHVHRTRAPSYWRNARSKKNKSLGFMTPFSYPLLHLAHRGKSRYESAQVSFVL